MEFPEIYKSDNIVYHYTKLDTAIKYILFNKSLKFSDRQLSNDPIERDIPLIFKSNGLEDYMLTDEIIFFANRLEQQVRTYINQSKQICFCKNNKDYNTRQKEYYGFLKPRMWDQYADQYKGICLALKKDKLNENDDSSHDINYLTYDEINSISFKIKLDEIVEKGLKEFERSYKERLNKYLFYKHTDYQNENELRIHRVSENKNDEYINISDAIVGVFMPADTDVFSQKILKEYRDQINFELFHVNWSSGHVQINNSKDLEEMTKENDSRIKKSSKLHST